MCDTYWPWLGRDEVYMFVAFSCDKPTQVKVTWKAKGPQKLKDTWLLPGVIDPNLWYCAWWKPIDVTPGNYKYTATVTPEKGKKDKDSCKFEVLP